MREIRPMTLEDAAHVAAWMAQIEPWVRYGAKAENIQARLERGIAQGAIVLVVDAGETKACGFALCVPTGMFDRSPYLRWIAIQPQYTSAGIGAKLLDAVEAAASTYDRDLFLLAADYNARARRFYERQGYQQMAVLPDYVVAGVAEVLYWKRLR